LGLLVAVLAGMLTALAAENILQRRKGRHG